MAKYKIENNENKISDAEIDKHKDFSKLVANYDQAKNLHQKPLYRYKNRFIFLAIVLIILSLLMFFEII